ncbi:DUF5677 domain-containing protein [Endobacterium cereale]|uniref:DUF5677 domain-containing protein n=1 Tax=Endobacterium cereale TaxID=2663029 RepID=UPI001F2D50E0|nr:DUF5677 domain-containing protein [Endobacterium cereale]
MNDDQPQINEAWLQWMRDFRMAAAKLADVDSFDAPEGEEPELLFVKFALFARALTLFDTALLLAEHDKVLDVRSTCRKVVECAIHMDAARRKPDYLQALKDDEAKSKWSRAKALKDMQTDLDAGSRKLLQEFLNDKKGAQLKPSDLSKDSQFPRMVHMYREISADTAHVTYSSLLRHRSFLADGTALFSLDPLLEEDELQETLNILGLAVLLCVFSLVRMIPTMVGDEAFYDLHARYKVLAAGGQAQLGETA